MFAVQVLVPVILAPLIFEETWCDNPARRRRTVRPSWPWRSPARRCSPARKRSGRFWSTCPSSERDSHRRIGSALDASLAAAFRTQYSSCEGTPSTSHTHQGAIVGSAETTRPDATKFAIGFDHRDRARLFELWTEVLDSEQWSEGAQLAAFEQRWAEWNGLPSLGLSSWAGGALAALEFAGVRGETVLCPSNTFMATPLAAIGAGAEVEFVDCNRDDLCMSFADFEAKAERHKPRAAILVHIGGHIAFDSERIAAYCRDERDLPARGLRPRPRRRLERAAARRLRRRRRLLPLRDQDGLDRRGRRARLRQPGADRVRRASSATTASSSTRSTASTSG